MAVTPQDGSKTSSRPIQPGLLFESAWGLPDLQFRRQVCRKQIVYLVGARWPAGLVETRRLELLTLSLQRRCSSN